MTLSNILKSASLAAVVSVLGFGALAAAPAQAAPGFSVQLGVGDGPGYGPGYGHHYGPGFQFGYNNGPRYCLSDGQIRSKLRARGFRDVQLVRDYGPRYLIAVGYRNGGWYQMRVERCSGDVDHIRRVSRRANGGFSIQLNF